MITTHRETKRATTTLTRPHGTETRLQTTPFPYAIQIDTQKRENTEKREKTRGWFSLLISISRSLFVLVYTVSQINIRSERGWRTLSLYKEKLVLLASRGRGQTALKLRTIL
jgi:tRNA(Met) C34 N-acetyltransferase TmcA